MQGPDLRKIQELFTYWWTSPKSTEIANQEESYVKLISLIEKNQDILREKLRSKRHPFLKDAEEQIEKLDKIFDEIKSRLKEERAEYVLLTEQDKIREKITSLFEGKVGVAYSDQKSEGHGSGISFCLGFKAWIASGFNCFQRLSSHFPVSRNSGHTFA